MHSSLCPILTTKCVKDIYRTYLHLPRHYLLTKGHFRFRQTLAMNPKHYSQIEHAIQCFDKSSTADFLKDNHYLFFIFKKTERFVAALYILTELFPDTEPIKWELRSSGTSLGKDVLSFRERGTTLSKENISDVFGTVIRTASLLEIAHIANLISAMNLTLFRKELDLLASFIEGRGKMGKGVGGDAPFHENFFRVSKDMPGIKHPSVEPAAPVTSQQEDEVRKGHRDIKDNVLYDTARVDKGHAMVRGKAEDRRCTILDVLKTRSVAVVKDFSMVIGGCSEKTVQRELLKMVQEGILRREGERRWSRYSLA